MRVLWWSGWGGGSRVWCVPLPVGETPTVSHPLYSSSGGPYIWCPMGAVCWGDILAPLQQLDHGCHLSVRQLMSLHLVSKFKRCRM